MNNEDRILSLLEKLVLDVSTLKSDVADIRQVKGMHFALTEQLLTSMIASEQRIRA